MSITYLQHANAHILYEADQFCGIGQGAQAAQQLEPLFTTAYWQHQQAVIAKAPGRGESLFVTPQNIASDPNAQWVLRPYRRGGAIARVSQQRYWWSGVNATRAFREFRLTATLKERGLAVPQPVGACVWRAGLTYQAAFISARIAEAKPLAALLDSIDTATLEQTGRLIRDAHDLGLDHVDLNARNLLIDKRGKPWIIDLDRCRLRTRGRWQDANLQRLERSLEKFAPQRGAALLDDIRRGYQETETPR
ncbi:3-deoxy-D-manno-octulosonic acid kinase [Carnimonas sp. R-84981]|uniref:3-deoxy-D-manno-octulosonic acid kinase n=1 Tax=Carnimonas bestiolae TaxID=3402172 RepID=UPI003EDBEEE5